MSQPQSEPQQPSLSATATYTSPTNPPFQISSPLELSSSSPPSSSSNPTAEETKRQRIAHLAQLRKAASSIQASVNKELTSRMEQDKLREAEETSKSADSGPGSKKKKVKLVDDEAEEQNYGEEVVEDSD
ncbi:hypothetical protein V8F20_010781 [Naviculisporaceae sp. PSN 640]